ncbi:MAG TPA: QsdR family transcriptional regulator [Pseudonocardia sp.]|nr:QsdR family transcriptional regulator [Pseudonocardia sp.]
MVNDGRRFRQKEGKGLILGAALRRYRQGQRIEIASLASELGISRASAYRWFGDNDRLLADVLVDRVQDNFHARLLENADKTGRQRVLDVVAGFLRHAAGSERFDVLLQREPQRVLKVVASSSHRVQGVTVQLVEQLLDEEQSAGFLDLAVPAGTLAYAVVRLMEGYLYADVMAGEKRDVDTAVRLVGLLIPSAKVGIPTT